MSDDKKKKNHTKSGLAKLATAVIAVAGIVLGVMNKDKNNNA